MFFFGWASHDNSRNQAELCHTSSLAFSSFQLILAHDASKEGKALPGNKGEMRKVSTSLGRIEIPSSSNMCLCFDSHPYY